MLIEFKKGDNIQLSKNFNSSEFECSCSRCESNYIDLRLIYCLQRLREKMGIPIIITSGYRCRKYNKDIGGASKSQHLFGRAADIQVPIGYHVKPYFRELLRILFRGLGLYNLFCHVDVRDEVTYWDHRSNK